MNLKEKFLHYTLLWVAARLYDVVLVHAPEDEVTAVHFARSERDLNISVRTYIDWLDNRTNETDTKCLVGHCAGERPAWGSGSE